MKLIRYATLAKHPKASRPGAGDHIERGRQSGFLRLTAPQGDSLFV